MVVSLPVFMKYVGSTIRAGTSGFSPVQLIISITVVAALAGSVMYLVFGFVHDAKYRQVDLDLKQIDEALQGYERNNYFKPPTEEQGLKALVDRPRADPQPERWRAYLKQPLIDPWGREYQYRQPAEKSSDDYDIFSLGEDGVASEDDIGNW